MTGHLTSTTRIGRLNKSRIAKRKNNVFGLILPRLIQTGQILHRYLDPSSHWIYGLLNNTTQVYHYIYTPVYFQNFHIDRGYVNIPPFSVDIEKQDKTGERIKWRINRFATELAFKNNLHRYDIIHIHFGHTACMYYKILKDIHRPWIVSFYGFDYKKYPATSAGIQELYKNIFRDASGILTEGLHGAELLTAMGCPEKKIWIQKLGVDIVEEAFPRQKKNDILQLVQPASFREKKGHIYTIRSFSEYIKSGGKGHLTFIGDGPLKSAIKELALQMLPMDTYTFLPPVSLEKLRNILPAYDVLIHPSKEATDGDTEGGAPVVLLDAQYAGLPVISTQHADIPSYVAPVLRNWLGKENDTESLVRGIQTIEELTNEQYRSISNQCIQFIKSTRDVKSCANDLENIYKSII